MKSNVGGVLEYRNTEKAIGMRKRHHVSELVATSSLKEIGEKT